MTARPVAVAQILTGVAAALALLYFLSGILIPFVIALVLLVLVNALVVAIERRIPGAPLWTVSIAAGLLVIVSASAGIFVLAQGAAQMVAQGPALAARLEQLLQSMGRTLGMAQPPHLGDLIGEVSIPQVAGAILSSVQGVAGAVLLIVVYFGFLLGGRRRIGRKLDALSKTSMGRGRIRTILERIAADITTYMWVQTVTGLMLALASAAVMLAVGLDKVLFWTVFLFLLSFIPVIGVTVASIVPALFALLQFETPWQGIAVFAGIQVIAFVIGNLVYPRMQANTQNIDPLTTLAALSVWTFLWGLPGAFLAVPMTLMLMMAFAQFENTRWVAALLSDDGKPDFGKPG